MEVHPYGKAHMYVNYFTMYILMNAEVESVMILKVESVT